MIYYAQEYSFKEGKYIYKYNVVPKKRNEGKTSSVQGREEKKYNLWNVKKKCLALSASMEKSIIFHIC